MSEIDEPDRRPDPPSRRFVIPRRVHSVCRPSGLADLDRCARRAAVEGPGGDALDAMEATWSLLRQDAAGRVSADAVSDVDSRLVAARRASGPVDFRERVAEALASIRRLRIALREAPL